MPPPRSLRPRAAAARARHSAEIDYARLHRHLIAADLATGARVVVLGCGDGEGATIIAETATSVVVVDPDPVALGRARTRHQGPGLRFVDDAGGLEDGGFDLAVCFDAPTGRAAEGPVAEAARLLTGGGLLLLSVDAGAAPPPDPGTNGHEPATGRTVADRLERLLRPRFAHLAIWTQTVSAGSRWTPLLGAEGAAPRSVAVSRREGRWQPRPSPRTAATLVAAASRAPLPPLPGDAELHDHGMVILDRLRAERDDALARARTATDAQEQIVAGLREEVVGAQARGLRIAGGLRRQIDGLTRQLEDERRRGDLFEKRYQVVIGSRGWRALQAVREVPQRVQRLVRSGADVPPASPPPGPVAVPVEPPDWGTAAETWDDLEAMREPAAPVDRDRALPSFRRPAAPVASIVVPVFNNLDYTLGCLEALAANTPHELMEVIVVDDASTDGTAETLRRVDGIEALRSETNSGFSAATSLGAGAARGRVVVFLNNDTEVQPGWLEALLDAVDSAPDVGAAGCKLVFGDGRLQEAGGIVWRDGSGANIGRGEDPQAPRHNVRREVDYCSAAALMVRRDLFERLGGFDPRFSPAYYEDTDLCFRLRENGFRVLYEPRAVVVHHEGATHGDSGGAGLAAHMKANQLVNRHVFVDRWSEALLRHLPAGTGDGVLMGRVSRAPRVLVGDAWIPRHDRDSGGLRMTWIVRLLRRLGCEVTLVPLDGQRREPYVAEMQRAGIEVLYGAETYADLVRRCRRLFDLVILSRPDVARACLEDTRRHLPNATVVYDAVDLEFVREQRRLALVGETPSDDFHRARRRELDVIRACDIVAAITQDEADVILDSVPSARTVLLPNVHALDASPPPGFDGRAGLVFLGSYDHSPNIDTALHLAHEVLPLVRRDLDVHLWLAGSNPPQEVVALEGDGITVTGYVPDVETLLRGACVFVAPLRYGAGMKGKIGHAMSHGLPVVTTTIGAEGMGLVDGTHALVRDDPEGFAAAVLALQTDRALWERISVSARELVRASWTPEAMERRLVDLLHRTVWVERPEEFSASEATSTIRPD